MHLFIHAMRGKRRYVCRHCWAGASAAWLPAGAPVVSVDQRALRRFSKPPQDGRQLVLRTQYKGVARVLSTMHCFGQRSESQPSTAAASRAARKQAPIHPPTCGCCPCSSSSWTREGKMTAVSSSSDGSCRAAVRYAKSSADVAVTTPEGKREPKRPARPATCTQMEAGQHATNRCSQPMNRAASRPATQPVNHPARFASPGQTAQPTCLISAGVSRRSWVPSNLRREVKTMRRMDRFSPMPTASADSEMGRWKVHSWGTAAVGTLIDTGCCHARQGPAHPA